MTPAINKCKNERGNDSPKFVYSKELPQESLKMSVGLYKYDGNIYDDAKEIISESIASQSMYEKYLKPAIKELHIAYFQDGAEIRKKDLQRTMTDVKLLIQWIENNVQGDDMTYLLSRLQKIQSLIPDLLANDDDVLYIF